MPILKEYQNYSDKYFLVKRGRKIELWEINLISFSFFSDGKKVEIKILQKL